MIYDRHFTLLITDCIPKSLVKPTGRRWCLFAWFLFVCFYYFMLCPAGMCQAGNASAGVTGRTRFLSGLAANKQLCLWIMVGGLRLGPGASSERKAWLHCLGVD